METINTILKSNDLTDKEQQVLICLNEQLKGNFGEMYTDVDCHDLADYTKMDVKSVKGVVGSLCKKKLLHTYPTDSGYEVVGFFNQEEMGFEMAQLPTIKAYDGETDVNIKSFRESLEAYPTNIKPYLTDDGKAGLASAIYAKYECGCDVKGNGTLQFPISIEYCKTHKAASSMLNRLKQLKSDMNNLLETVLNGKEVSDEFVQNKINELEKEIKNATA